MSVKLIFLDLDGVLNSYDNMRAMTVLNEDRAMDQWHNHWFDGRTVMWLKYILNNTGARIVITSTWRHSAHFDKMWQSRHMPDVVISRTPRSVHGFRGEEIDVWMSRYGKEKIQSYLILDDDRDMLPEQWPYFVQTKGDFGITMVEARKGIRILNSPPHPQQMLFEHIPGR